MNSMIPEAYEMKFENGIRHPFLFLWDAWSYEENNTLHLYSLAVARFTASREEINPNNRNDYPFHIRHFISKDNGLSWKDEGCFLSPEEVSKLNYRTIWSGSVSPMPNGKKLVAYTGLENSDADHRFIQNIAIAISDDGYAINHSNKELSSAKKDWNSITEKGYYLDPVEILGNNNGERNGPIMTWRDPFVFYDKDNNLQLFWAAKIGPRTPAIARATLKHLDNSIVIEELHPPVSVPDSDDFTQIEVPKIIFSKEQDCHYLIISSCNRLHEKQEDIEISKEIRVYKSKHLDGPWESLGDKILGDQNLFGMTVLKTDFKNNRLLCIAPYTEKECKDRMLSFAPVFYIYLDRLRVEFVYQHNEDFKL